MLQLARQRTLRPLLGVAWVLLGSVACSGAVDGPVFEGPVQQVQGARPWLMYATVGPEGGRFGGLDGALEPGSQASILELSSGRSTSLNPDANGRFSVAHEEPVGGEVQLTVGAQQTIFRVRQADSARQAAVLPPAGGVGAVPNDLIPLGTASASHALVVRSGDNAVSHVSWHSGLQGQPEGIRLPNLVGAADTPHPSRALVRDPAR